eukprot:1787060-Amphidinium_carterae.1
MARSRKRAKRDLPDDAMKIWHGVVKNVLGAASGVVHVGDLGLAEGEAKLLAPCTLAVVGEHKTAAFEPGHMPSLRVQLTGTKEIVLCGTLALWDFVAKNKPDVKIKTVEELA